MQDDSLRPRWGADCVCSLSIHVDPTEMRDLTEGQWAQVDALILSRQTLQAVRLLKGSLEVRLSEAMEIHHARYRQLREERPGDFLCSDAEYWEGVYS